MTRRWKLRVENILVILALTLYPACFLTIVWKGYP